MKIEKLLKDKRFIKKNPYCPIEEPEAFIKHKYYNEYLGEGLDSDEFKFAFT